MMDKDQTVFHLTIPNVAVVQELKTIGTELQGAIDNDSLSLETCYDLAAKLFSCNRLHIIVTADELKDKDKYDMELEDLILFFNAYTEFISKLIKEKN